MTQQRYIPQENPNPPFTSVEEEMERADKALEHNCLTFLENLEATLRSKWREQLLDTLYLLYRQNTEFYLQDKMGKLDESLSVVGKRSYSSLDTSQDGDEENSLYTSGHNVRSIRLRLYGASAQLSLQRLPNISSSVITRLKSLRYNRNLKVDGNSFFLLKDHS